MYHRWKPLILVSCVFLITGATICMNDILLPTIKKLFQLSYTGASMIQQSFYIVYLFFPIPIAYFVSRYGYKIALITSLYICSAASLIFIPAYYFLSFTLVLVSLFIISIGVTLVNVAANPLAAQLGHPSGAHVRVNIVQLFSRVGFSATPVLATKLIQTGNGNDHFHLPYLIIGGFALVLGLLFLALPINVTKPMVPSGFHPLRILKQSAKHPQLRFGIVAMFFYMGAEAGTAGFFISYLNETADYGSISPSSYLSYYYLASTITSFFAVFLMNKYPAGKLLSWFGIGLAIMYLVASVNLASYGIFYLLAMGVFISILFPLIFSLSIEKLGHFTEKGSALINMAIVGGAIFPPLQGLLADHGGVHLSYLIPCLCVFPVIIYGFYCYKQTKTPCLKM